MRIVGEAISLRLPDDQAARISDFQGRLKECGIEVDRSDAMRILLRFALDHIRVKPFEAPAAPEVVL